MFKVYLYINCSLAWYFRLYLRALLSNRGTTNPQGRNWWTAHRFHTESTWGSFPKDMKSPGSWFTRFPISCKDMSHSCVFCLSPRQSHQQECVLHCESVLPQEIPLFSHVWYCSDGHWSLDVVVVQSCPYIVGHTSCGLLDQIIFENLQEAATFILNPWLVVWLINLSVTVNIGHVLQPAAPHGWLPGSSWLKAVRDACTKWSLQFICHPSNLRDLLVRASLTAISQELPGNRPWGTACCKTCPILTATDKFPFFLGGFLTHLSKRIVSPIL